MEAAEYFSLPKQSTIESLRRATLRIHSGLNIFPKFLIQDLQLML